MRLGTIEIVEKSVFVDGKKTKNPTLIGLAMLNALESDKPIIFYEELKVKLLEFISKGNYYESNDRLQILKEICGLSNSFSAKELYNKLIEKNYTVSMSTVYYTISLFVKAEIIKPIIKKPTDKNNPLFKLVMYEINI